MGAHFLETVVETDGNDRANIDPQDVAYWNCYCNLKEVLNQDVYMKYYGNGDFDSFCEAIDLMNSK